MGLSDYSPDPSEVDLTPLQVIFVLTTLIAAVKRYMYRLSQAHVGNSDMIPLRYMIILMDFLDLVEGYLFSQVFKVFFFSGDFTRRCARQLKSCLHTRLIELSQTLKTPDTTPERAPKGEGLAAPSKYREKRLTTLLKKLMGQSKREISLRSGTYISTWKISRPSVRVVVRRTEYPAGEGNCSASDDSSSESSSAQQSSDWYGHQLRQQNEGKVPEVVERFGRPRSLLQSPSTTPRSLKLLSPRNTTVRRSKSHTS